MTNKNNSVLYIGVTNDLVRRVLEHREGVGGSFTAKYNVHKLVYYESHKYIKNAIDREKKLKNWKKQWKQNLIKLKNPDWVDLLPTM